MRIKGGGAKVMVEAPRKKKERRPEPPLERYHRDTFEVAPRKAVPPSRSATTTLSVVKDLAEQGRARVAQDERRPRAQLMEVGELMGALTAELVVELINHFVQRPPAQRSGPMVVLGALTSALFVEFWTVLKGDEALDRALTVAEDAEASLQRELGYGAAEVLEHFVAFIEETEGQPVRRLMGTLYAQG